MSTYSHSYSLLCPGLPGDLIVFRRPFYRHYAVNVGGGYIVHVTSASDDLSLDIVVGASSCFCSSSSGIAVVKRERFSDFVNPRDKVEVENGVWRGKTALEGAEIVRRALASIGKKDYNLLFQNCEHFARWCRYGEEKSDQAENFGIGVAVVGGLALVGAIAAIGHYASRDSEEEEKKRRQRRY